MPFKCALCELDIQVGESMVSDEKMNLAHESCVRRGRSIDPLSTVAVPPPPPAPPSPIPASEAKKMYAGISDYLSPPPPKICVECQRPAISMCSACHAYVHQNYGYDGGTACSVLHEGKCSGARSSRDPNRNLVKLSEIANVGTPAPTNGRHATPKAKKKRGRR